MNRCLLTVLLASCTLVHAAGEAAAPEAAPSMADYTTCAVYFRMVVGSMSRRSDRDLGPLAELEQEKLNRAMALARQQAVEEYGEDLAEEIFQEQWRAVLADMTTIINRNYQNIRRLSVRYDNWCEALMEQSGN